MSVNVGTVDRALRAVLGVVLLGLPVMLSLSTLWTILSVVAGVVMLGVAATRVCPIYSIFGLRTCPA